MGRQAWGQQGLGVQVRDGGSVWRGLWAGKNRVRSRDILVTVGTQVEHVWRERGSVASRPPVAEWPCGRRAGWLWGIPGMGMWENKMCGDDAVFSVGFAGCEGLVGCTGKRPGGSWRLVRTGVGERQ